MTRARCGAGQRLLERDTLAVEGAPEEGELGGDGRCGEGIAQCEEGSYVVKGEHLQWRSTVRSKSTQYGCSECTFRTKSEYILRLQLQ
jgi:hypothetical protein